MAALQGTWRDDYRWVYFDGTEQAEEQGEVLAFLRARLCEVFDLLMKDLDPYLWHRDRFILEPCLEEVPHLTGHLRIGDGTEDEWFVVYLLRQLSLKRSDVSCRVVDADGELILIEAAGMRRNGNGDVRSSMGLSAYRIL
eukprot:Skav212095  [mRNA]  locus=scaffold4509:96036:106486:+ [translate_table: standard]